MIFLHSIGLSQGRRLPLADAITQPSQQLDAGTQEWLCDPAREVELKALAEDGFDQFVEAEAGTAYLAKESMKACLQAAAMPPADLEAVLFSTESFWDIEDPALVGRFDPQVRLRHGLLEAMAELGLTRAFPYANWMSACANFGSTLAITQALIASGHHRRAMLVFADKVPPWVPRLMRNGAAPLSDLAASCIVGPEPRGFRVKKVVNCAAPAVASYDPSVNSGTEVAKLMRDTIGALKRLERDFASHAGRRLSSFDAIIGGHFHPYTLRIMCEVLRIRPEALLREGRGSYAHANAADNLVTLSALDRQQRFSPGQEVVLLNTGVWSWNLVLLERTADVDVPAERDGLTPALAQV